MYSIDIKFAGYGHFEISTKYRGKVYKTTTTSTQLIDRYRDTDVSERAKQHGYTRAQAADLLRDQILRANKKID